MAVLTGFWIGMDTDRLQPVSRPWARGIKISMSLVLAAITLVGMPLTQGTRFYYQAVRASYADQWSNVIDYLQRAVALSPQSWVYPRQLGFSYGYLAGEDPTYRLQAMAWYDQALQSMDRLPLDQANYACLLWDNGEQNRAIEAMTQARNLDPENGLYHFNLGYYLESEERYEEAWPEYALFVADQPEYLHSDYWQQTKLRQDNLPLILEMAIDRIKEREGEISLSLARLYTEAGYFDEALEVYAQLEPVTNNLADIHLGRAKVYLAMEKLDQALAELELALALEPDLVLAYQYRGDIYLRRGQLEQARQNTELALSLQPSSALYYQRAQISVAKNEVQKALGQYEAAIIQAQTPPHFRTDYALAARILTRRVSLARELLPCIMIPYVTDELVLPALAKGELLEAEGQWTEAAQVYQLGLSFAPNESRLERRLEKLCRQHPASC